MTVRVPLDQTSWTRIATGEADVLATVQSGGAMIHIGGDADPGADAVGHYIDGKNPFNGHLLVGEVVWAKGNGVLIVTPGEDDVPA